MRKKLFFVKILCFLPLFFIYSYKNTAFCETKPQKMTDNLTEKEKNHKQDYKDKQQNNIYIDSNKNILFSARDINDTANSKLFVIYNKQVILRSVKKDKFEYEKPKDGCYQLENQISMCVSNGEITNLLGNYHTMANDERITKAKYNDEFFNEENFECNKMKFDVINKLFVKNEELKAFQLQIYLLDYYSLLKMIIYQDDEENARVFVISDKNDIGCSKFNDFLIYKYKPPKEDNKKKKKKKSSKKKNQIEARNEKEFLQKVAVESYKKMLLSGYTYLQPMTSTEDVQNIVLSIENSYVKSINILALDFEWTYLKKDDLI